MLTISRKSFSNVRQKLSRPEGYVEVSGMIWGIFMSATTEAAVYLGQDHEENLHGTKNTDFEQVKALFTSRRGTKVKSTGCVDGAPRRAHLTHATHTFFLVWTWLNMFELCCVLSFLKSHSISSMFRDTLLDTLFSSALSFGESIHCHSARRVMLWPIGWTISFSQVMSPSLSSKSAASTTISRPRWCVWNNRHDRRGTVDFTTVFSGARSKCFRFQCFWFSDTFNCGDTHTVHSFVLKHWETGARRWFMFKFREIIVER